jgi:hypothetical protein
MSTAPPRLVLILLVLEGTNVDQKLVIRQPASGEALNLAEHIETRVRRQQGSNLSPARRARPRLPMRAPGVVVASAG